MLYDHDAKARYVYYPAMGDRHWYWSYLRETSKKGEYAQLSFQGKVSAPP